MNDIPGAALTMVETDADFSTKTYRYSRIEDGEVVVIWFDRSIRLWTGWIVDIGCDWSYQRGPAVYGTRADIALMIQSANRSA